MKCTDNKEISRQRANARRRQRRKRRRQIRRLLVLLILLCIAAVGILVFKFISNHQSKVAAYEAEHYNCSVSTGELFSSSLCVASEDVSMDGAPDSANMTSAALFDVDHAATLYAYHIHEKLYPASLTKLMTALVALEEGNLDDVVTVSENADSGNFALDEKTCGIKAGDQISLRDLLYGLILYSGNDNAVAIAEAISGDVTSFADLMNEEAKKIQANNSHFVNPNGLHDEDHYTTAYDLYLIFQECLQHEDFLTILGSSSYEAKVSGADGSNRTLKWEPTNLFATGDVKTPDNANVIGGKTGTTLKAGNCLILLNESKSGGRYISIIMGAESKELLYQNMTTLIKDIPQS